MYICLCHAVTDRTINEALENGASSVTELMKELKVATQCGSCLSDVSTMVEKKAHQAEYADELVVNQTGVQIFMPLAT